jgi:hypothetical protein
MEEGVIIRLGREMVKEGYTITFGTIEIPIVASSIRNLRIERG